VQPIPPEEPERVCEAPEPVEPVIAPVVADQDAKDAKDNLDQAIRSTPTPTRSGGRVVQHGVRRVESAAPASTTPVSTLKSLKFPAVIRFCLCLFQYFLWFQVPSFVFFSKCYVLLFQCDAVSKVVYNFGSWSAAALEASVPGAHG